MRHRKHHHSLGVKKEHRSALLANLASALIRHGRIRTTLAKAKALRPFVEKAITLAKKAASTEDIAKRLHLRRLALARLRDESAARILFNEKAGEFKNRSGGYTRIYKLIPRKGDAAEQGLIELMPASEEGQQSSQSAKRVPASKGVTTEKGSVVKTAAPSTLPVADKAKEAINPKKTAGE